MRVCGACFKFYREQLEIAVRRTGHSEISNPPGASKSLSASKHLTEHGIDLSQFNNLDGDELMEALGELQVDVDSGSGDTVRVFCE